MATLATRKLGVWTTKKTNSSKKTFEKNATKLIYLRWFFSFCSRTVTQQIQHPLRPPEKSFKTKMVWQQQNKIFFLGTKTASSPFVKILQKTTTAGFVCLFVSSFSAKSGRLKKSEQANRHNRNFFNKKVYRVRLKWSSKPTKKIKFKDEW